jgi:hypothetical protein
MGHSRPSRMGTVASSRATSVKLHLPLPEFLVATLDFVMEPPFECGDDDAGDVAFIKATHCIGGRDVVEDFMAYGLHPLSASFGLGEIVDGKTPVSKLCLPLLEFLVARLPDEMNDHFRARVERATENVMGSYAHREHDVCITSVLNEGRVNRCSSRPACLMALAQS